MGWERQGLLPRMRAHLASGRRVQQVDVVRLAASLWGRRRWMQAQLEVVVRPACSDCSCAARMVPRLHSMRQTWSRLDTAAATDASISTARFASCRKSATAGPPLSKLTDLLQFTRNDSRRTSLRSKLLSYRVLNSSLQGESRHANADRPAPCKGMIIYVMYEFGVCEALDLEKGRHADTHATDRAEPRAWACPGMR